MIEVKRRASKKYQRILRRILEEYGYGKKGCHEAKQSFVYVMNDNTLGIMLLGIDNPVHRFKIIMEAFKRMAK